MGLIGNFLSAFGTAMVNSGNRARRSLRTLAAIPAEDLIVCEGNAMISCKDEGVKARAIAGRAAAYASNGWPVVLAHEGNDAIVSAVHAHATTHGERVIEVDGSSRFYEPLLSLDARDAASLIYRAAMNMRQTTSELLAYLEVLTRLVETRRVPMCLRALQSCPNAEIFQVIANAEAKGRITSGEAAGMRAVVDVTPQGRVAAQGLLLDLIREGDMLPDINHLMSSYSLSTFARSGNGAVLCIDMGATTGKSLLSIILTEAEDLVRGGFPIQLILAVESLEGTTADRLSKEPAMLGWSVVTKEMGVLLANNDSLSQMAASCERLATFSQGVRSAEMVSALMGEYEVMDANPVYGGYSLRNPFGSNSISISRRRDRVVQPEQIHTLRDYEFIVMDAASSSVMKGRVK